MVVVVVVFVFVFVIVGGVVGERGCRAAVVPAQRSFVVAAEGNQRGGTGHPLSVYQNEALRSLVRAALGGAAGARRRCAEWLPRLVCMNWLVGTGGIAVNGRTDAVSRWCPWLQCRCCRHGTSACTGIPRTWAGCGGATGP